MGNKTVPEREGWHGEREGGRSCLSTQTQEM